MKKLLILTDYYYPKMTSIGACVDSISKEFVARNYEIHILSYGDENQINTLTYNGIVIHNLKYKLTDRIANKSKLCAKISLVLKRIGNLLWINFSPMTSLSSIFHYYKSINRLNKKYNYDMIISTYSPFEGTIAQFLFKTNNQNIPWVLYVLDSFSNRGTSRWLTASFNEKKGYQWEKKLYDFADLIINMKCHEKHHNNSRYDLFKKKMIISDIPNICFDVRKSNTNYFNNKKINITYTGRILSHLTSPIIVLKVFEEIVSKSNNLQVHFFSSGDCENLIFQSSKKTNNRIISEGLVQKKVIPDILNSSDILLSIGCADSDKIASKIFDYISTGKKIIHFKKNENDSVLSYYFKYSNILIVDEKEPIEKISKSILDFIDRENTDVDEDDIRNNFIMNMPSYTVDLIEQNVKF